MQLASMLPIFCNIQHLVHQQSKHKIQLSTLRKRTIHHFQQSPLANGQSAQHDDIIVRIEARAAWNQKWSQPLKHCAGHNPKKILAAGKQPETHFLLNKQKEKCIVDYVERDTAVARKRVEDTETAIIYVQDDMRNAEKAGLATTKPETTFEGMSNTIGNCLGDIVSSNDEEDGEDEDYEEELTAGDKVREDEKPGGVMGTISSTVQYRMECFQQKQIKCEELM